MPSNSFLSIGECLLEFTNKRADLFQLQYAGDTLNVAYYCQYCINNKQFKVDYFTALGDDVFSENMLANWRSYHIGVEHVRQFSGGMPGLYLIHNDEKSERHFYYYRSQAPARRMFEGDQGEQLINVLKNYGFIYFSGITLAILLPESLEKFKRLIKQAKSQGAQIIFDNNYRARLWQTPQQAQKAFIEVLSEVDIALPSYHDAATLFGDQAMQATASRLHQLGVKEVVVKAGEAGYLLSGEGVNQAVPIQQAPRLIDTSGAGDSFNGAYLAKRLTGSSMEEAGVFAAGVAANVVQHQGAIIPPERFL